jgi:hypothetical protein
MAEKPKRRVPLGPPLRRTPEDLDRLSQITEADIEAAQELWRSEAPPRLRRLLDAIVEEDDG